MVVKVTQIESKIVVARGRNFSGYEVSIRDNEKVLETDGGDSCAAM
jgi:hypothetical protein